MSEPSKSGENIDELKRMREYLLGKGIEPDCSNSEECIGKLDMFQEQKKNKKRRIKRTKR